MSADKAQCSATCSSFFHATRWLIASSLSFIRRHLVSDREKPLNTLSIHTFHPGLPGRPRRYSWPLIRSAFCNYSTHLLSGVRGVQLVQALPCSSFVTRSALASFLSYDTFLARPRRLCFAFLSRTRLLLHFISRRFSTVLFSVSAPPRERGVHAVTDRYYGVLGVFVRR